MNSEFTGTNDPTDTEVSAAYAALQRVASPEELDNKILHAARRAAKDTTNNDWMAGWLRPATFVATVGLSIALLLELSESRMFAPADDSLANSVSLSPVSQRDSLIGDAVNETSVVPTAETGNREESSAFRNAADATAEQIRAIDASAGAKLQEMPKAEPTRETASDSFGAVTSAAGPVATSCTTLQRENADEWWRCISQLRDSGNDDAALVEAQNLRLEFPQFSPP